MQNFYPLLLWTEKPWRVICKVFHLDLDPTICIEAGFLFSNVGRKFLVKVVPHLLSSRDPAGGSRVISNTPRPHMLREQVEEWTNRIPSWSFGVK
ncbi:hypothetical protein CEXT_380631 [Caerostris extrusa]|uniref:Uncharacterized protein n=1 Tax=Caerostris extrusa TaxID=172846 RepID=A0AAV4ST56_CAEEX|nr:hypothetical protein CEXT_380631 [Caerostris extrusa]